MPSVQQRRSCSPRLKKQFPSGFHRGTADLKGERLLLRKLPSGKTSPSHELLLISTVIMYGFAREAEPTHSEPLKLALHAAGAAQVSAVQHVQNGHRRSSQRVPDAFLLSSVLLSWSLKAQTTPRKPWKTSTTQTSKGVPSGWSTASRTTGAMTEAEGTQVEPLDSLTVSSGARSDDSMTFLMFCEEFKIVKS